MNCMVVAVEAPDYRVKRNEDGSVDVWVAEQRIHFPLDGKPFSDHLAAPQDAAKSSPDVSVQVSEAGIAISCHGRVVLVKPDGSVVVVPDKPPQGAGRIFRRYRMRRTHG